MTAAVTHVVKAGRLIEGTGAAATGATAVIIEDGLIADVRPLDRLGALPAGAHVYDGSRCTAMPGIIDCHDHVAHFGLDLTRRFQLAPSLAVLQVGRWLDDTLRAGVTTLRDAAGVDLGVKMAVDQGVIDGPRLLISLVIISQTGGHGDLTQPSGLSSDLPRLPGIPDGIADGTDGVRRKVREVLKLGADWIKIATNGGGGSPRGGYTTRQFCLDEVRVIVDEAHSKDVRVMAHAHGGESLDMCLAAGVDTVEHGGLASDRQLEEMARRRIWLVPTLSVTQRMVERIRRDPTSVPAYTAARVPAMLEEKRKVFRRALALGVPMAMGTDAGALGHAENARELVYMVEAGMTPMQSIVASTGDAARLLSMDDRVGTLRPGRRADLLLVAGDPLDDIAAVADPGRLALVMKDGRVYKTLLDGPASGAV
ncbi:MAG TPA: amidohydrolase family protein [bacterium]|nr:amidohydrolase family protein [bacterium]